MVKLSSKKQKSKKTEFSLLAPSAQSVFLSGNFNRWDLSSHLLKRDKNGMWKISLNLEPGQYENRFLVDGEWQNDPSCCDFVDNLFGTSNCIKIVG
jgi:1,4-alpha-glucan branching enzyme